jgi:hypothetical protein
MSAFNVFKLLQVLDDLLFACSVLLILITSIMLFSGACINSLSNAWHLRFISDQLALCLESDSPSWRAVPWLLAYGVAYQALYLLRLWNSLHRSNKQFIPFSGLLFHASVCHFITNVATVIEFKNNSQRLSKHKFLIFNQIQENTIHTLAAVQAFVNISILHTALYYQFSKPMRIQDEEMKSYRRLDVLYIVAVFTFCVLWIANLIFAAAVEWVVLVLAFFLQSYAINRWQIWVALQDNEVNKSLIAVNRSSIPVSRFQIDATSSTNVISYLKNVWNSHVIILSVIFFLGYIVLNIVTIYIIAPPMALLQHRHIGF